MEGVEDESLRGPGCAGGDVVAIALCLNSLRGRDLRIAWKRK